ncbi:MAG: hypothetical protein ACRDDA_01180 [Aeromonas sp.]
MRAAALAVAVSQGRPAEGKMRLAFMAGELIYANVRLRLTANRTYELPPSPLEGEGLGMRGGYANQRSMLGFSMFGTDRHAPYLTASRRFD